MKLGDQKRKPGALIQVEKSETDESRDLWFWKSGTAQLCNRRTNLTPRWCFDCGWASAGPCPSCFPR